jgi:minor extracellular protease Epr
VASLLWQKDLSKSSEFIRQLIETSAKKIKGKNKYGLLDAKYALHIYDKFSKKFKDVFHQSDIEFNNQNQVSSFTEVDTDEEYVTGRWESIAHTNLIDGLNGLAIKSNAVAIGLLKEGIVYPDSQFDGKTRKEWHGQVKNNYIACYDFMTEVALLGGNTAGVSYAKIKGMNSTLYSNFLKDVYIDMNAYPSYGKFGSKDWITLVGSYEGGNKLENRKFFIWGAAMHILTDSFCHSTVDAKTGNNIAHNPDNYEISSENTKYYSGRYLAALGAAWYSLVALQKNTSASLEDWKKTIDYVIAKDYENISANYMDWKKKKLYTYDVENAGGKGNLSSQMKTAFLAFSARDDLKEDKSSYK